MALELAATPTISMCYVIYKKKKTSQFMIYVSLYVSEVVPTTVAAAVAIIVLGHCVKK